MELDSFILEKYDSSRKLHQEIVTSLMQSQNNEYLGNIYYMIESIYKRKANDFRHLNEVFIAYYNDYPIGLISITYLNERQEISIGILEKYRHQYLGSLLTFEFMEKIFELYPDINELYGVIDGKNINSQKMAKKIGSENTFNENVVKMRR